MAKFGQRAFLGAKWLYRTKVVVFVENWVYSSRVLVFGQELLYSVKSGFIRAKLL